ncbi:hypothetical protein [Endozoicomonas sp. ALB115]|uniref:hypothetical protein n=1 Tax=Endozoicomonas sp. ALB115 TaxID=3403074 RepID=UPI003BB51E46
MSDPIVSNPALITDQTTEKHKWTCASWFNKISEAVASKTSRFFGRAVAAVVAVVAFIPSLAVDLVYAVKSLYDRKVTKPQTMTENQLPVSRTQTTTQNPIPEIRSQTTTQNPTPETRPQTTAQHPTPETRPQTTAQNPTPERRPQTTAQNPIPKRRPQTTAQNPIPERRPQTTAQNPTPERRPQTTAQRPIPKSGPQPPAQRPIPKSGPQPPAQRPIPKSSFKSTAQKRMAEGGSKTLTSNLQVIPGAKVQWQRYIIDDDVRDAMERYNRFLAVNVSHHPEEIPKAAYSQLEKARDGAIPIELITQDAVKTVKLKKRLGAGASKTFYDTGDGQALAMNAAPHQFYDELMMHSYLKKSGIPTLDIEPAVIRWEFQGTKYSIATHIAPSFSEYAKENAFEVISKTSLKIFNHLNGKKVLSEGQKPSILENWDAALTPLVKDIRNLIDNGVYNPGDAFNMILVGKGAKFHSGGPADYEVRAFPIDFSSKIFCYDRLPVKNQLKAEDEKTILKAHIKQAALIQLDANAHQLTKDWKRLVDNLAERYLRK